MKPKQIIILICVIVLVIALIIFSIFIFNKISLKKKKKLEESQATKIIEFLGGKENISSLSAKGSRLSISLIDQSKLKEEELKKLGVSSIIYMSNKIILVVGSISLDIENIYLKK